MYFVLKYNEVAALYVI